MEHRSFGVIADTLRRSTVHIRMPGRGASGSGVVWDSLGTVVTNAHVAAGSRATVEVWDGRRLEGTVTARDLRRDLAKIRVPAAGLVPVRTGDSDHLRPGELVIAVGNPLGFTGAVSTGVVHALGPLPALGRRNWVQADVRLAPGNSGGPLADAEGRVVGLNTMIAGGLALAIPSNTVASFVVNGVQSWRLGVTARPVRDGLMLLEIEPDSPAHTASLLPGDVLTGVNGAAITHMDDLFDALERRAAIRLTFFRGDGRRHREVTVQPGAQAEAA